ncbi:aspartyl/asparaginyl beta-hydroxylase domain-containing protein [Stenotrophomonas maltophilia]|uniref:aspartyl/asparaginyl beta-hydroxylase domain-containing protein n=1 Tax=Stenotrophomonas maltophilia TaxID=40324 RepID=UPI0013DA1CA4|nr:aspartyl/asparaginyl beta-hydroxylase domain-containing protein [Stenotrophomonas maltophilia]
MSDVAVLTERALAHARNGDTTAAEQSFRELLQHAPEDVQALNFIARCHSTRGEHAAAERLLQRALAAAPDDAGTLKNLAVSLVEQGQWQAALAHLQPLLAQDPGFFVARLYLALSLQQSGAHAAALTHFYQAVSQAQRQGHWTSAQTTPPGLRRLVEHAMRSLRDGRRHTLQQVLAPLQQRHGRSALQRIEQAVAGYLGELRLATAGPEQRPTFLYIPGLPSPRYFDPALFPWYETLQDATPLLREELLSVLEERQLLAPFLGEPSAGRGGSYLGGDGEQPRWDGFFFHRHGKVFSENAHRCPRTAAALEQVPLVRIEGHAPETLYSVLGPGSHILPHTGVTNSRIVTHLPLIVPEHCALRVAGEEHAWQEGRCVSFDDTWEHEAWNRSQSTRVVLLFDVWNPGLDEAERDAIDALVRGIAELNGEDILAG